MSNQYVGEIRLFPFGRGAPVNWHICDGTLLSIAQYEVLYTLIGTTYGGNGQTTFGLPDLRGRVPIHQGTGPGLSNYPLGSAAGTEAVTLTTAQMPHHNHMALASTAPATSDSPAANVPAAGIPTEPFYVPAAGVAGATVVPMLPSLIQSAGGGLPHENCAPTLTMNYCIALFGIFPSQG